jgi:hypothetical protein
MLQHDCPTNQLETLRGWAWARGRTDVILLLDVHEFGWDFTSFQRHGDLGCFAELIPRLSTDIELTEQVTRLALAGGSSAEITTLSQRIEPWLRQLCVQLADRLSAAGIAAVTT